MKKSSEELLQELQEVDALIAKKQPLSEKERQRLKEIRERGFLANIKKGAIQGRSLKQSISESLKAKVVGIKEKFNPLNIGKSFIGKTGTALLGRKLGASSADLKYFLGDKKSVFSTPSSGRKIGNIDTAFYTTVAAGQQERMRKGDGLGNVAGKLFNLIQNHDEKSKLDYELQRNFKMEALEEEERQHYELIDQIKKSKFADASKLSKFKIKTNKTTTAKKTPSTPTTSNTRSATPTKRTRTAAIGTTVAAAAIGTGVVGGALSLGNLIAEKGESGKAGYNAANKGTKNGKIVSIDKPEILTDLTVGEIMARQSITFGSKNESQKLFAVGKYQIIPDTMKSAVAALGISPNEKFTPDLQERMFKDYLITVKRPAIAKYLNSPTDDPNLLKNAVRELSYEWASIADPDKGGMTSHYGSGNKAIISVNEITDTLKKERENNLKNKKTDTTMSNTSAGSVLDKLSVAFQDMTGDSKNNLLAINNSQTIITSGGGRSTQVIHTGSDLDLPLFMTT